MNDWPLYMRVKLKNDPTVTELLGNREQGIYAAGSLSGPPDKKPFITIHTDEDGRGPFPGRGLSRVSVHVHDQPGTYSRIRLILHRVRAALEGPCEGTGVVGGGTCRWLNDSGDIADEGFNTIVRTGQYQMTGADGND
jgi:hypothetical protein